MLGISGISRDVRTLLKSRNKRARLAIEIFTYRLSKYIGAYMSALNGADAIVFTGGIGENSAIIRENALNSLRFTGLILDKDLNSRNAEIITKKESNITALAIKTDEELMIAKEVVSLLRR